MKKIRIGTGSGFSGDIVEPAVTLVEKGDIQYLSCDHLAELTLTIQQKQKERDPSRGYAPDITWFANAILPQCAQKGIKWLDNGGGANPKAAGERVIGFAQKFGLKGLKVAVVTGDDILGRIDELRSKNITLANLDTGEEFDLIRDRVIAANVYTGTKGIVEALRMGADVVITGRTADPCMWMAPMIYEFGWREDDWDRLALALVVGHLVECSGYVTGGNFSGWKDVPEMWRLGYPIAEVSEDGEAIITKTEGTGGMVTVETCKEHLLYEMHDPSNFMSPDVVADITGVNLEQVGKDRVRISGVKGKPKPEMLKVCIGYPDGWIGEGETSFSWPDALEKAKRAEQIIRERFKIVNLQYEDIRVDFIGFNSIFGALSPEPKGPLNEVRLRVAVKTRSREEAAKVGRETVSLWTTGPAGATGILAPPTPREVLAYWPTLVPQEEIQQEVTIEEVK